MKMRAFTLIELLMVIAIMGILGTITAGGYRAMQRGMEERGVVENVTYFIDAAYRRAQIDRQPVAVYFWNECLREESDNETMLVVGKAAAVRRTGRISRVVGSLLYDEFADLDRERLVVDDEDLEDDNTGGDRVEADNLIPIYKMNSRASCGRSLVGQTTKNVTDQNGDTLLSTMQTVNIPCFAYVLQDRGDAGSWKMGDAYGVEFAEIQLPHGYIFGKTFPTKLRDGIATRCIWFSGGRGNEDSPQIEICSLRQNESGGFSPEPVAETPDMRNRN